MIRDAKGQDAEDAQSIAFREQPTDDRGIYRIYGTCSREPIWLVRVGRSFSQAFQFNPYDSDVPTYAPSSTRDNAAEVSVRGGEETTAIFAIAENRVTRSAEP